MVLHRSHPAPMHANWMEVSIVGMNAEAKKIIVDAVIGALEAKNIRFIAQKDMDDDVYINILAKDAITKIQGAHARAPDDQQTGRETVGEYDRHPNSNEATYD